MTNIPIGSIRLLMGELKYREIAGAVFLCVLCLSLQLISRATLANTIRVSISSTGVQSNYHSLNPASSEDGNYALFWSGANNLVIPDNVSDWDLYLRDISQGVTTRVITSYTGGEADNNSVATPSLIRAAMSADGNYVAFSSYATNLVAFDTNGKWDVFRKNLLTGETELVSTKGGVDGSGEQGNGDSFSIVSISADGRFVTFKSDATNLLAGVDSNAKTDIFTRDMLTGIITRQSTSSGGLESDNQSITPAISADGNYVAFRSVATNLTTPATDGWHIFVKNLHTGLTVLASSNASGDEGNGNSDYPVMNAGGSRVAFSSVANNLVSGHMGTLNDVFVKHLPTGAISLVSVSSAGAQGDGHSDKPSISNDGRYVVFESTSTNLVDGDTNGMLDVFVHDLYTGVTERLSTNSAGAQVTGNSDTPVISGDGRYVFFRSDAVDLLDAGVDTNGFLDVYRVENILFVTDTDNDGLRDDQESDIGTSLNDADTDGDGLLDGAEVDLYGTDPLLHDSDGDGAWDGLEVSSATDPRLDTSYPTTPVGDISGDGKVDAADVLLSYRILTNQVIPTSYQSIQGNVAPLNAGIPAPDEEINAGDVSIIQQKALGIINF